MLLWQDDASSTSSSQAKPAPTKSTPPHSASGSKIAGFVSAISTQLENVSSGRGGDAPLSKSSAQASSTDEEGARLAKELARVKNELRLKDKQLSSTQKSMQICEEELVALEQECKGKIAQVQHEVRSRRCRWVGVGACSPVSPLLFGATRCPSPRRTRPQTSRTSSKRWK